MCAMCTVVSFINVPASLLINAAISIINIYIYLCMYVYPLCESVSQIDDACCVHAQQLP